MKGRALMAAGMAATVVGAATAQAQGPTDPPGASSTAAGTETAAPASTAEPTSSAAPAPTPAPASDAAPPAAPASPAPAPAHTAPTVGETVLPPPSLTVEDGTAAHHAPRGGGAAPARRRHAARLARAMQAASARHEEHHATGTTAASGATSPTGATGPVAPAPAGATGATGAITLPGVSLSSTGPIPNLLLDDFRIPPFLLPIYQAAGIQYGVRWEILAAINEIETDYGRNLSVSSAGAEGWMQFEPSTWAQYGVDANHDGRRDPYNPVDAIFATARYLHAAGYAQSAEKAIFAYNHADWYVRSVLLRARLVSALPGTLVDALTGLTEGRFPVAATSTYRSGAAVSGATKTVQGSATRHKLTVHARAGAPVVAVQDGEVVELGHSKELGRYIVLRDVWGNTYTYSGLGSILPRYLTPRDEDDVIPATPTLSATATARAAGSGTAAPSDAAPGSAAASAATAPGASAAAVGSGAAAARSAAAIPSRPAATARPGTSAATSAHPAGPVDGPAAPTASATGPAAPTAVAGGALAGPAGPAGPIASRSVPATGSAPTAASARAASAAAKRAAPVRAKRAAGAKRAATAAHSDKHPAGTASTAAHAATSAVKPKHRPGAARSAPASGGTASTAAHVATSAADRGRTARAAKHPAGGRTAAARAAAAAASARAAAARAADVAAAARTAAPAGVPLRAAGAAGPRAASSEPSVIDPTVVAAAAASATSGPTPVEGPPTRSEQADNAAAARALGIAPGTAAPTTERRSDRVARPRTDETAASLASAQARALRAARLVPVSTARPASVDRTGATGIAAPGTTGATAVAGAPGTTGATAVAGAPGRTGAPAVAGATVAGATVVQVAAGPAGPLGATAALGVTAATGPTVGALAAATGPIAASTGPTGQLPAGATGATGELVTTDGAVAATSPARDAGAPAGPAGPLGATALPGVSSTAVSPATAAPATTPAPAAVSAPATTVAVGSSLGQLPAPAPAPIDITGAGPTAPAPEVVLTGAGTRVTVGQAPALPAVPSPDVRVGQPVTTYTPYARHVLGGLPAGKVETRPLRAGSRVVGGTVLGHLGGSPAASLQFEIRPAGRGAPQIDPTPIVDGWRLLESSAVYRPSGVSTLSRGPLTVGRLLLDSKAQLTRLVLKSPSIKIYECGRDDIRAGRIDRRVLAVLAFLAAERLKPTVSALECGHGVLTDSGNVSEHSFGDAVDISAINGVPILGHQGPGSITETTIQKLLTLQGTMVPHQIISLMTFPGAPNTLSLPDHDDHIHIGFRAGPGTTTNGGRAVLRPAQWQRLVQRLDGLPLPEVADVPSTASLPDRSQP